MQRREFLGLLGGVVAVAPFAASAQEAGRVYRLGFLHQLPRSAAQFAPLFDGLRRQGFLEGRNLAVDARGFAIQSRQYQDIAAELVKSGVDALFCGGDEAIRAAQQVTRTIPIAGVADDMVGSGLAASLARPGGNTTASASFRPSLTASAKSSSSSWCPARAGWRRFLIRPRSRPQNFKNW